LIFLGKESKKGQYIGFETTTCPTTVVNSPKGVKIDLIVAVVVDGLDILGDVGLASHLVTCELPRSLAAQVVNNERISLHVAIEHPF
jgi:hypothetical protein